MLERMVSPDAAATNKRSILRDYEAEDLIRIMRNASDKRDWVNRPDLRGKIRKILLSRHRQSLDPRRKSARKGKGMAGHAIVPLNELEIKVKDDKTESLPSNHWIRDFYDKHSDRIREKAAVKEDQKRAEQAKKSVAVSHLAEVELACMTLPKAATIGGLAGVVGADRTFASTFGGTFIDKNVVTARTYTRPVLTAVEPESPLSEHPTIKVGMDITVIAVGAMDASSTRTHETRVNRTAQLDEWVATRTAEELLHVEITCVTRCDPDIAVIHPDTGRFSCGDPRVLAELRSREAATEKALTELNAARTLAQVAMAATSAGNGCYLIPISLISNVCPRYLIAAWGPTSCIGHVSSCTTVSRCHPEADQVAPADLRTPS